MTNCSYHTFGKLFVITKEDPRKLKTEHEQCTNGNFEALAH